MIFTRENAKLYRHILSPDVEKEIIMLLNHILKEKEEIFDNPNATDSELRAFQGQKTLITELKQYRNRLNDTVIREKESKLDGRQQQLGR